LRQISQDPLDQFSRSLHQMTGTCSNMTDRDHFLFLKGRYHDNQLKSKNWRFFVDESPLSQCHSKMDWNITIPISKKIKENEFLYIVYNFGDVLFSNPRDCESNNCTFLDETAKINISDQISQQLLDRSSSAFQHM